MTTKPTAGGPRPFEWGWARWILEAGLLSALPLIFYRGFSEQFTYPKIILAEALLILGTAGWALGLVWGSSRWPRGFPQGRPLGVLAAAILLSCIASSVIAFSFAEAGYFLGGPLWLCLLACSRRGGARVQGPSALITIAGAIAAGIALVQWTGRDPLLFGGYSVQYGTMVARMRLYSTFGNPNFLCGYLIGAVFPALGLALTLRSRLWKMLCTMAAAIMLAAIIGAGSFGGWAGLAAGAAVAAAVLTGGGVRGWLAGASEKPRPGSTLRVALAPLGLTAVGLISSLAPSLSSRIAGRVYLWRVGWQMFLEHPLLGSGWGTFQLYFLDHQARFLAAHPELTRFWTLAQELHNDPFQLLVEAGLLGFAAFVWLWVDYGREVRKQARAAATRPQVIWLSAGAGGATAILADSLFNFQFSIAPTLILLFTFLAFPAMLREGAESPTPRARKRGKKPASAARAFLLRAAGGIGVAALCAALMVQTAQRALAERDYERGINFESRGNWGGAELADREGLRLNPQNGKLHFALARVLYLQQKYEPALAEAEAAGRTYADSHLVVLRARILERMGRGSEALQSYRRALDLDPTLQTVQADIERLENLPSNPQRPQ